MPAGPRKQTRRTAQDPAVAAAEAEADVPQSLKPLLRKKNKNNPARLVRGYYIASGKKNFTLQEAERKPIKSAHKAAGIV